MSVHSDADEDDTATEARADDPPPAAGYRTYEVYQRERVGESTNLIDPRELIGAEMLADPTRLLTILREDSPCSRDWIGNRFWITRYDDVTSVFVDEANYESRSAAWRSGRPDSGRDLGDHVGVRWAHATRIDRAIESIVEHALAEIDDRSDLAIELAARLPLDLWGVVLDLDADELATFARLSWTVQRGIGWDAIAQRDAALAFDSLVAFFDPIVERRRVDPGDDMISAIVGLDLDDGPTDAADVATTVVEWDHETLHGGLANLWYLLLTHPDQLDVVRSDRRLVTSAWLEALRHSPPVLTADRYARHEVERFGRLIPEGGLLTCSAAAANRDPRVFDDPDTFDIERKDLCRREPRGHYRADGLPSGIAFGLGRPSIHPAVPKERPRSLYALTRDIAVTATSMLLDEFPGVRLADGAEPVVRSLRLGEMRTCWRLPVELR